MAEQQENKTRVVKLGDKTVTCDGIDVTALQSAFLDYDLETLPDLSLLPAGFTDQSWRNDQCPTLMRDGVVVSIDFEDPIVREDEGATPRYLVTLPVRYAHRSPDGEIYSLGDLTVTNLATEDWGVGVAACHRMIVQDLMAAQGFTWTDEAGGMSSWCRATGDGSEIVIASSEDPDAWHTDGNADARIWMMSRADRTSQSAVVISHPVALDECFDLSVAMPTPVTENGENITAVVVPAWLDAVLLCGMEYHPDTEFYEGLTAEQNATVRVVTAAQQELEGDIYDLSIRVWAALGLTDKPAVSFEQQAGRSVRPVEYLSGAPGPAVVEAGWLLGQLDNSVGDIVGLTVKTDAKTGVAVVMVGTGPLGPIIKLPLAELRRAANLYNVRYGFEPEDDFVVVAAKPRDVVMPDHIKKNGQRVAVTYSWSIFNLGVLPAGAKGTVVDVDPAASIGNQIALIKMDDHFEWLNQWDNELQVFASGEGEVNADMFEAARDEVAAAGWIVFDGAAIWASGATEAKAWSNWRHWAAEARIAILASDDAEPDFAGHCVRESAFRACRASAALLADYGEGGGAISWSVRGGVACSLLEDKALAVAEPVA